MRWRRVLGVVLFAAAITMGGHVFPFWLGVATLPGAFATAFLPVIRSARLDISMHIWTTWFVNLFFWAVVGDWICVAWERRQARRAAEIAHA